MAVIERIYNIPLRRGFLKSPKYRRAKKAISVIKEYVSKHMKSEDILLGPRLNLKVWENGIKNPPHHVKVSVIKDDKGQVRVELIGFEFKEKVKAAPKGPQAKGLAGKLQSKLNETKTTESAPKEAPATKKDLKKADEKAVPKTEEAPKAKPVKETPKAEVKAEPKAE